MKTGSGSTGSGGAGLAAAADAEARYRAHLARFGVREPGDRIVALPALAGVARFALREGTGLRLKALVTGSAAVIAGGQVDQDWRGLLTASTDAAALAEALAWLETDESPSPHRMMPAFWRALAPGQRDVPGVDPAHLALVEAARLGSSPDVVTFTGWLLPPGTMPVRWTITAPAGKPATLTRESAQQLAGAGGPSELQRARAQLADPAVDHLWALGVVGAARDGAAVPAVTAILLRGDAEAAVAARALASIADAAALEALTGALGAPGQGTRIAVAQELGRLHVPPTLAALVARSSIEADARVRLELVRALAPFGAPARPTLQQLAQKDSDPAVRGLAAAEAARIP
ncbi:MAG: HEAT repeat domain-containing protein [Deltaproteobacteria bacterium]|nr:HEAT repeat domain-containing protein [Deltaproteobacteria bacterium]